MGGGPSPACWGKTRDLVNWRYICLWGLGTVLLGNSVEAIELSVQQAQHILGIGPSSDLAALKKAYRSLAQKAHPDKNRGSDATASFQLLNQAYDLLKQHARGGVVGRENIYRVVPVELQEFVEAEVRAVDLAFFANEGLAAHLRDLPTMREFCLQVYDDLMGKGQERFSSEEWAAFKESQLLNFEHFFTLLQDRFQSELFKRLDTAVDPVRKTFEFALLLKKSTNPQFTPENILLRLARTDSLDRRILKMARELTKKNGRYLIEDEQVGRLSRAASMLGVLFYQGKKSGEMELFFSLGRQHLSRRHAEIAPAFLNYLLDIEHPDKQRILRQMARKRQRVEKRTDVEILNTLVRLIEQGGEEEVGKKNIVFFLGMNGDLLKENGRKRLQDILKRKVFVSEKICLHIMQQFIRFYRWIPLPGQR